MKPVKRVGSDILREFQLEEAREFQKHSNRELRRFIDNAKDKRPERIRLEKENPGKKLICFWASKINDESKLPWPRQDMFMGNNEELEKVASYLDNGKIINHYMRYSSCRLCGEDLGASDCSDGTYVWPSKCSHYLRKHRIFLPGDFMDHVLNKDLE